MLGSKLAGRGHARPSSAVQLPSMASPVLKGHGSTTQLIRNTIPTVVNGDSLEKWTKHGGGTDRGFE